jgi:hypothetical protein
LEATVGNWKGDGAREVRVVYDVAKDSLTGWFDRPQDEHESVRVHPDVVLKKNRAKEAIGLQKLHFKGPGAGRLSISCETTGLK